MADIWIIQRSEGQAPYNTSQASNISPLSAEPTTVSLKTTSPAVFRVYRTPAVCEFPSWLFPADRPMCHVCEWTVDMHRSNALLAAQVKPFGDLLYLGPLELSSTHLKAELITPFVPLEMPSPYSVGTVFIRQNLTSVDVRFWCIKTISPLKELKYF